MTKSKLNPDLLHLADVKIVKAQIDSPLELYENFPLAWSLHLDFDASFNLKDNLVRTVLLVEAKTDSGKEDEKIQEAEGMFQIAFFFLVENLKELTSLSEDNVLIVDTGLLNALASISYSTARGILLTRYKGTAFNDFILPIIRPNDLYKDKKMTLSILKLN